MFGNCCGDSIARGLRGPLRALIKEKVWESGIPKCRNNVLKSLNGVL